jgi:enoyl-CoA hydratase
MPGFVTIEEHGDVALVRVDRPPANAMDTELLADGHAVLEELAAAEPGSVVLTGRDGFFSAGMDLKVAPTLDAAGQQAAVEGINRLFLGWYSFPRPVVCAVNGHAIAGGLILALCGDYRVGNGQGKLGLTELRAGLGFPLAAMAVVKAELTPATVRVLALGTELVDQRRGLELELLDELAEPDALMDRALELAAGYAALPQGVYARVKDQVRGDMVRELRAALERGADPTLSGWVADETAAASAGILDRSGA